MAIDTREKRMSMLNFGDGSNVHLLFEADGTAVDADDRLHLLDLYSGISAIAVISYTSMGDIFLFTSANWTPAPTWHLEATMRATSGTAEARLFDLTDTAEVADSPVTTASATHDRVRSSAITLTDAHEYEAQFGTTAADSGEARGAGLIGIV